MQVSICDRRDKIKNIIKSPDKKETVKGATIPAQSKLHKKIREHPFFGMSKKETGSISGRLNELRKKRHNDV